MNNSRTLTISIDRPPAAVYAFVTEGSNSPRWLSFVSEATLSGDEWLLETPAGQMSFRYVAKNDLGVLDHRVLLPDGSEVLNPMRVVANDSGSEVMFTLFQRTGVADAEFDADIAAVERDLRLLKQVMELEGA